MKHSSLYDESCLVRATDINPNELHYNSFTISLDTCNGSCNTLDYQCGRKYVSNKTKDIILNVFNMITKINKSKR